MPFINSPFNFKLRALTHDAGMPLNAQLYTESRHYDLDMCSRWPDTFSMDHDPWNPFSRPEPVNLALTEYDRHWLHIVGCSGATTIDFLRWTGVGALLALIIIASPHLRGWVSTALAFWLH